MEIHIDINMIESNTPKETVKSSCSKPLVSLIQYLIYYIWKTPCPKTIPFSFTSLPNTI
jgi:hypothetical protein